MIVRNWPIKVAKAFLYALILSTIALVCAWCYIYTNSATNVQENVASMAFIVSEQNTLSNLDSVGSRKQVGNMYDGYMTLLETSETPWLKYDDTSINVYTRDNHSVLVNNGNKAQRGTAIVCQLTGYCLLPMFVHVNSNITGGNFVNIGNATFFKVNISKTFITIGTAYYTTTDSSLVA